MKLTPLVYVTDMNRSIDFYTRLLPAVRIVSSSPYWTELEIRDATLALHYAEKVDHSDDGMGLGLDATDSLEDVVRHLEEAGITSAGEICSQPFGRSVTVEDPDGLVIQINEHAVIPSE
jgi:catechol 2,3-dioxygenase-like lactoylglutathione lyase family enzyme